MRIAGYQGERSVHTRALRVFAAHLRDAGGLPAEVTASPGGTARALFDAVEASQASWRACYMATGYLAARVPELAVLDLPFSVFDREGAFARLDGEAGSRLGVAVAVAVAVAARTGLRLLGFWDNGARHVTNRCGPIHAPADCRDLTIRTLDSPIYREALAALGFTPVVTDVAELRRAVATGAVDAQENPLANTFGFGLHAYHPYLSLTGHFFGVVALVCEEAWHKALPARQRDAIRDAAAAATASQRLWAAQEEVEALAGLQAAGVAVLGPDEFDRAAFRAACEPVSRRVRATLDPALVATYLSPDA